MISSLTTTELAASAIGALGWTLAEYLIHRFRGHSPTARGLFRAEHMRHHGTHRYFSPTWKKALATLPLFLVLGAVGQRLFGSTGLALVVGFAAAYGYYELMHRLIHVWAGVGPYARWARRHHFYHHFGDAKLNHGVTSPLWDLVFGTFASLGSEVVQVPRKFAPDWMVADGELRPGIAGYRLFGAPSARAAGRAGGRSASSQVKLA
jgi:sterol desaturase/sphingolipid hydroxylase (fatty acid hydroxylase superfamily)